MQPAAKLRENPINVKEIEPKMAPKKAPKPVITPERVVMIIAFDFEIPLFFNGSEIDIPSGMSWRAIAIASFNPKELEDSKPEPNS